MIELIGEEGTSEYNSALSIVESISQLWPGVATSAINQEHIRIASNVKISGYDVTDIDIVICGIFHRKRKFIPRKVLYDSKGHRITDKPITIQNFILVVEVKDHSENSVQISGDKITVKYSRGPKKGWKSATDQNLKQVFSLQNYLKDLEIDAYVHRCVLMNGLGSLNVAGAIATGFNGNDLFTAVASASRVKKYLNGYILSSGPASTISQALNAPIFKLITPTALDRKRMDMIVTDSPDSKNLLTSMSYKMVRLRGHGGTGKTVMCLQMAWKAFENKGLRTLFLTYNHALAADIRRLLALLRIPSSTEEGGVKIVTVMSFIYSWFYKLGVLDENNDLKFDHYDDHCKNAIEMLSVGAITTDDISEIISNNPDDFDFDYIVVDEAQDWPQNEADLLKKLYAASNICIADGIDQLLRGKRTEWETEIQAKAIEIISLTRCLRMKRNLAVFVNQIADAAEVKWSVEPNNKAGGGKVIVLLDSYDSYNDLHTQLLNDAKNNGNAEIDFLFCVPPSDVRLVNGKKQSDIGQHLKRQGFEIWDGVDAVSRKDFPRLREQFRIVQYASCRGLEGWTIVLNHADVMWEEYKSRKLSEGLTKEEQLAYENVEELACRTAWHGMLIPLTRPIDTLVISLHDPHSVFSEILLNNAKTNEEFIEII